MILTDEDGDTLHLDSYAAATPRETPDKYVFVVMVGNGGGKLNCVGLTRAHAQELAFQIMGELAK